MKKKPVVIMSLIVLAVVMYLLFLLGGKKLEQAQEYADNYNKHVWIVSCLVDDQEVLMSYISEKRQSLDFEKKLCEALDDVYHFHGDEEHGDKE